MGRPKGTKLTGKKLALFRERLAAARERKANGTYTPTTKSREAPTMPDPPVATPALAAPAAPVDMRKIERGQVRTRLSKLRSLEGQVTQAIEALITVRRQLTQTAQEEER